MERNEIPDFFKVGADGSRTINTLSNYAESIPSVMNVKEGDFNLYDLQTAVSMWISYIMNGGEVSVEGNNLRKKENPSPSKRTSILTLDFSIDNKDRKYPSYHVGFGYSYILSIIVTALIAKENDIVIIENPEAHLHPEAQARLTFLLAKLGARGVQVFVETHSEHVLNGFRLAALKDEYNLKNDDMRLFFFDFNFQMEPLLIEPNGRINNWPKRFF